VPGWGDAAPQLLIVGLAPGLKGANRTGRPFTGDFAGDLLYGTLAKLGLSEGRFAARADDGLRLNGVRICNAVHCVPPQNKPTTTEIATCRRFLVATLEQFGGAPVVMALGRIAHESVLTALAERRSAHGFAHGARHLLGDGRVLFDSYHCSRYNTNTGRLTPAMFEAVMVAARDEAGL
jgi:uracil-DNA glycosylase